MSAPGPMKPAAGPVPVRPLTLVLVDDHTILREGLRALLELQPNLVVVGEAGNFEDALIQVRKHLPDVVLTDIGLPGRSGLTLIRELRQISPGTRAILLTAYANEEYIRAGLEARADGYVLKDSSHSELLTAIHTVASGQHFLCKAVASQVLATYARTGPGHALRDPLSSVTSRERQVLTHIATGQSNKEVARHLNLSVKTVEKHRANLMRKLSLHNASDITRFALLHHMVGSDSARGPAGLADLSQREQDRA